MLSFENAIRYGLLLKPRSRNDWFDVISMIHSFCVVMAGFFIILIEVRISPMHCEITKFSLNILTFQALFYLDFSEILTFLSGPPSSCTVLLFALSICYYVYDLWAMNEQSLQGRHNGG